MRHHSEIWGQYQARHIGGEGRHHLPPHAAAIKAVVFRGDDSRQLVFVAKRVASVGLCSEAFHVVALAFCRRWLMETTSPRRRQGGAADF